MKRPAMVLLIRFITTWLEALSNFLAEQCEATLTMVSRRTLTDLDLVATRIMQDVDVSTFEEVAAARVCEPADYVSPPSVDLAGSSIPLLSEDLRPLSLPSILLRILWSLRGFEC